MVVGWLVGWLVINDAKQCSRDWWQAVACMFIIINYYYQIIGTLSCKLREHVSCSDACGCACMRVRVNTRRPSTSSMYDRIRMTQWQMNLDCSTAKQYTHTRR
jgi:hypothetical protein